MGFLWVQAHVWVEGNEVADRVSKASLGRVSVDMQVPFGRMEWRNIISERLNHQWQQKWDTDNRVKAVQHPPISQTWKKSEHTSER